MADDEITNQQQGPEVADDELTNQQQGPEVADDEPTNHQQGPEVADEELTNQQQGPEVADDEITNQQQGPEVADDELINELQGPEVADDELTNQQQGPEVADDELTNQQQGPEVADNSVKISNTIQAVKKARQERRHVFMKVRVCARDVRSFIIMFSTAMRRDAVYYFFWQRTDFGSVSYIDLAMRATSSFFCVYTILVVSTRKGNTYLSGAIGYWSPYL